MPLVEHQTPGGETGIAVAGGEGQDQRMVGDRQIGVAGAPRRAFDEAAAPVAAGRMHAFAAPVGERGEPPAAGDPGEPAGEVSPRQVAVAGAGDPARDQPVADAGRAHAGQGAVAEPRRRVLEIEEAEIVLAALADDDLAALVVDARVEAIQFAVDLPLQVAGVGGDPHRAFVFLHPDAGGREVAQSLAHARPGFGEDDPRPLALGARTEGGADGGGVVGLLRPGFRRGAEQGGEPGARFRRLDGFVTRFGRRRSVGPFRQAVPDLEASAVGGRAESAQRRRAPAPAMRRHPRADGGGGGGVGVVGPREFGEQRQRAFAQGPRLFGEGPRFAEPESGGEAARRRHAELRRAHEGEQFQRVAGGEGRATEPAGDGGHVTDDGRRARERPRGGLRRSQRFDRAVARQPRGPARPRRQRRQTRRRPAAGGGCRFAHEPSIGRRNAAPRQRSATERKALVRTPCVRMKSPADADAPRGYE